MKSPKPWLRFLCAHLLPRRHFSISGFFTIAFVLDKCHWDSFPSKYFDFPLSEPFHHCSIFNFLSSVQCCKNYAIDGVVKCHTSLLPMPLTLWTAVYVDGSHVWYRILTITKPACNSSSLPNDEKFGLVFGSSQIKSQPRRPDILAKHLRGFPQFRRTNAAV